MLIHPGDPAEPADGQDLRGPDGARGGAMRQPDRHRPDQGTGECGRVRGDLQRSLLRTKVRLAGPVFQSCDI